MSHRFVTLPQLSETSGLKRQQVRTFVSMLETRGILVEREGRAADTLFGSLGPLGGWLRRAISSAPQGR